ncbi:P-loop containing nucleoside triphosphate hydrolase protein, partial [Kalaharituber pfeilii]
MAPMVRNSESLATMPMIKRLPSGTIALPRGKYPQQRKKKRKNNNAPRAHVITTGTAVLSTPHAGRKVHKRKKSDSAQYQETQPQTIARDGSPPRPPSPNNPTPDPNPVDEGKRFERKDSPAAREWMRLKSVDGAQSDAIDELMQLTGLEKVKDWFLGMWAKVQVCKVQGVALERERFHAIFQGNPGTGKTTVARLYARFLHSIGKLASSTVVETSGAKLAYDGPDGLDKMIELLLRNEPPGGVIFVDEAYQLTATHSSLQGRQCLDVLLTQMENNLDKLVFIFVGYHKEMESFFEHNPGLTSRITYNIDFDDFEDWELCEIMKGMIHRRYDGKLKVEGGIDGLYMRICIRRLGRQRGFKGFGNATAVETTLQNITDRQARRIQAAKREATSESELGYFLFTKEDLIGREPSTVWTSSAWQRLQSMIGLDAVKKSAASFIRTIQTNYQREIAEYKPLQFSLNRIFVGNPGTGKTTVAKLYGQILADLGFLTNGEVVIKSAADFIGACLGKSESQTKAILAATIGN